VPDHSELRAQLFYLFSPYGRVIDIVAQKGPTKRGQAFIVFRDLASATSAMRSLDGEVFYDKKMQIEYAKTPSHATLKLHDPNFIPPNMNQALGTPSGSRITNGARPSSSKVTVSNAENDERKRVREGDQEEKDGKKRRVDGDDMDMDEDEDETSVPSAPGHAGVPAALIPASSLLYCENLPAEVTEDVLGVLFQQYSGFQGTKLSAVDSNTKSKTAHVRYDTAEQAAVALEALNGFQIKRGWKMRAAYAVL